MKIQGVVFLVIGLAVSILSKIVNAERLVLFMYFGIGMALFGILRIMRENKKKQQLATNGSHYITRHHKATQHQQTTQYYCRYCGSPLQPHLAYCPRCHARR
jgi:cytochrome c biogenesis protein CcdA